MIMKKQTVAISMVFCALLTLVNACSENKEEDIPAASQSVSQTAPSQDPPAVSDGGKCAALMTAKCTECHSPARVCEKLGKKSKARWQRTIERMTTRGAKLNADETAALLLCLDSGANDLQATCR